MSEIKSIIHLDMDAFYAAVEVLDNPSLKGLPVIVGGLGTRGVVSTASYEARAYGVHSALPISTARRRCPHGIYVMPRGWRYQELSDQIINIFKRYTPLVEPLSLDEAFLDVTGSLRLFGAPQNIASRIKAEVKAETGLIVSAGVASQKHLAKIASGMNKPDGLTIVPVGKELDFLWPLALNSLWGVGKVMHEQLKNLGLKTIGDLAALDRDFMKKRFGQMGEHLWDLANGLDQREVIPEQLPKSVGAEETFAENLNTAENIKSALLAQTMTAVGRMRRKGFMARTVSVKFRDHKFQTKTRAVSLPRATDIRDEVYKVVLAIYEKEAACLGPMRLLGVCLSRLCYPEEAHASQAAPIQRTLFDLPEKALEQPEIVREKRAKLNQALDQLDGRFGVGTVRPATLADQKKNAK